MRYLRIEIFKLLHMKLNKYYLVILFCIINTLSIYSQSSVVISGSTSGEEANVSYSIGQPIVGYGADNKSSINIGVQQIFDEIISSAEDYQFSDIILNVFPNPFVDNLEVMVSNPDPSYKILIYDTKGSLVSSFALTNSPLTLNLSSLPEGVYYLALTDKNLKLLAKEKILKHI